MSAPTPSCLLKLWHAHEAELRNFLRHQLPAGADADDALQELFVKLLQQGAAACGLANPRAWLFQVARNALIDRSRSAEARRVFVADPDDLPAPTPEEPPAVDRLSQCLPRVLSELAEDDRLAITLCDIEGLSQQALADRLGLSLAGAKSRVQRARARLRARLITACQVRFDEAGQVCCFVPRPPLDAPETP